jgi:hypothetical protein
VFRPKTELAAVFPLKSGQQATVEFESRKGSVPATTHTVVALVVKGADELYIGPCKYGVFRIERNETRNGRLHLSNTDYYASDLKLIIAKEWKERDGKGALVKFDRIYPIKR